MPEETTNMPLPEANAVIDEINAIRGQHRLSLRELAEQTGLSQAGLIKILNKRTDPWVLTISTLANWLELNRHNYPMPNSAPNRANGE